MHTNIPSSNLTEQRQNINSIQLAQTVLFLALINQLYTKVFDDILALVLDPDPVIRLQSQSVTLPPCESYVITY